MDAQILNRLLVLACCLLAGVSFAQSPETPVVVLPEVVVHGARAGAIRVFKREEIEKSGAQDAAGFLSTCAGFALRDDGVSGGKKFMRIGGSNVNQVLVFVDGVRFDDLGSGEADLSRIPAAWIESIEVSEGGGALGSETIGGVISIRTLRARGQTSSLASSLSGTFGEVTAKQEWSHEHVRVAAGLSRSQGSGRYRYRITEYDGNGPFTQHLGEEFKRENNEQARDRFFAKLDGSLARFDIIGSMWLERSEFGVPGYLSPQPTLLANQSESFRSVSLSGRTALSGGAIEVSAAAQRHGKDYADPDPYSFLNESRERASRNSLQASWNARFAFASVFVSTHADREMVETGLLENGRAQRNRWGVSDEVREELTLNVPTEFRFQISGGVNAERFGDSELQPLPHAEVAIAQGDCYRWSLGTRAAKSFRAPDFYSLFWNDELLAQGNSELRPETAMLYQLFAGFASERSYLPELSVKFSQNRVRDLIVWRQAFDGRWTPQNVKHAALDAVSVELSQDIVPRTARIAASMEWLEARDRSGDPLYDGNYLTYRPPRTFRADAQFTARGFQGFVGLLWSDRQATLETNSKWLPEYSLVKAGLSKTLAFRNTSFDLGVRCDNVLDTDYRIVRHAPMPLRTYWLSLGAQLKSESK